MAKFSNSARYRVFLGFFNFYSIYIPYFEQRATPLRPLAKLEMEADITQQITPEIAGAREDPITAILSDPCVAHFNHKKKSYLLTDVSKLGYGYNLCQTNDDPASIAAMEREMAGGECEFLMNGSKSILCSCGMVSRKSRGREPCLHSDLNEGFGLDWGVNSNRSKLWARRFTAITDCYALHFILSYEGPNPVILRLQMRLMLWAMDLYHRNAEWLILTDYLSQLGIDMKFNPLTREYVEKAVEFRRLYAPLSGPMRPENMPWYREPNICSKLKSTNRVSVKIVQDVTIAPLAHDFYYA